jgi:hypothetical protein
MNGGAPRVCAWPESCIAGRCRGNPRARMNKHVHLASLGALFWSAAARAQPGLAEPVVPPPPAEAPEAPAPPAPPPAAPAVVEPAPADQGPDSLPSLEEPPALSPPPAVTVRVVVRSEGRPPQPVRAERRLALLGELGWNSLAGVGPLLTFHAHPHVSFDLGAGLGAVGAKIGVRARYNVLKSALTPFVGVGLIAASGFDAPSREFSTEENREFNIKVLPSTFMQAVTGLDWTSRGGFTMVFAVGYAWLLGKDNVVIITGEPTAEERRALGIVFRDSAVVSLAIGYTFD